MNKSRKKTPGGLLPYPVIVSAVSGNVDAINMVLEHFSATERMKAYLEQIKNPYCFRCGETVVRLCFAPAGNDLNSHLISFFGGLKKG